MNQPKGDIPNLEQKSVLVAEDEYSNFIYLKKLLFKCNANVLHAKDGQEAIELLAQNENVVGVLMDIKMPVMDGFDSFVKLRELNETVPIIAQTAYAFSDEIRKIKEQGFNDYISKPINAPEFYKLLAKYFV